MERVLLARPILGETNGASRIEAIIGLDTFRQGARLVKKFFG